MVLGMLLRSNSASTTSTAASPPLAAARAPVKGGAADEAQLSSALDNAKSSDANARTADAASDIEDLDWELVEVQADTAGCAAEPLSVDDYLVVESTDVSTGDAGAESALATPRQGTSADEGVEEPPQAPPEPPAQEEEPAKACCESPAHSANEDTPELENEKEIPEPHFCCRCCDRPIFKACEIISSNYHAQTSPGYLLSAAHNVSMSPEVQKAVYTTGSYDVQEVACQACSKVLGVTYSGADEARNKYKVGKFLIGSDRLRLPDGVEHPMNKGGA